MNKFGKALICLLSAGLLGFLLLVDYPAYKKELQASLRLQQSETEEAPEEVQPLKSELEQQLQELTDQLEPTQAALCVGGIQSRVYTEVYPVLESQGLTAMVRMVYPRLTGDLGQMSTAQFLELMERGWTFAVAGDETLETGDDPEQAVQTWRTSLEGYLRRIRTRSGVAPTVYWFRPGEYRAEYLAVLEELGFTSCCVREEDLTDGSAASGLAEIVCIALDPAADPAEIQMQAYRHSAVMLSDAEDAFSAGDWEQWLAVLADSSQLTLAAQADAAAASAEEANRSAIFDETEQLRLRLAELS